MKLKICKIKTVFHMRNLQVLFGSAFVFLALIFGVCSKADAKTPANKMSGAQVLEAEKLLSNMGYWVSKVDTRADASTRHAIITFQKVEGRKRTGVLNTAELAAIRTASRPTPKYRNGAHVEIDISRQVLFLVDASGTVIRILPVSTGSEKKYKTEGRWEIAHTPRGEFQIRRQINGIRHAPLGALYYPNYFYGGVAIHGNGSVPVYAASHGCVRIPNFAAKEFQTMVYIGMPVIVYD